MNALDRLIIADGVQGGTIHTYNRLFGEDVTSYEAADFARLARRLLDEWNHDAARLASNASIAHLTIRKARA